MYTDTHFVLSQVLRELCAGVGLNGYFFRAGSVRPDQGRTLFRNHGSAGKCRKEVIEKIGISNLRCPGVFCKSHEMGVGFHYLEDALDRSKRCPKRAREVLRDIQHCQTLALYQVVVEKRPTANLTKTALLKTFRKLKAGAKPDPSVSGDPYFSGMGQTEIRLGFHDDDDLSRPINRKRSYAVTWTHLREFIGTLCTPQVVSVVQDQASTLLPSALAKAAAMSVQIEKRGFTRFLSRQSGTIYHAGTPAKYGQGWLRKRPSRRDIKVMLNDLIADLGVIVAFAKRAQVVAWA